jgi:hypothetical protein
MTTKKPNKPGIAKMKRSQTEIERPIALTLKIDSKTYIRLSTLRAKDRKTAQEILAEALQAYLDQAGA